LLRVELKMINPRLLAACLKVIPGSVISVHTWFNFAFFHHSEVEPSACHNVAGVNHVENKGSKRSKIILSLF
jgi:hypothetical protein